jgi:hypothetical protein
MRMKNVLSSQLKYYTALLLLFFTIISAEAQNKTSENQETKNISSFAPFKKFNEGAEVDLNKGQHLVSMFSLDCDDCMETAKLIGEMNKSVKLPPVHILFLGTEDQVENFFTVAECRFPYKILDAQTFFSLLDAPYPPRVCIMKDGKIMADFKAGNEISKEKLEKALLN